MSTYVVSDIHGCYQEFLQLLEQIRFDHEHDILVCAGDYIDRGSQNAEMLNWIAHASDHVIFLQGNHEEEYVTNIEMMQFVCQKYKLDKDSMEDTQILYQMVYRLTQQMETRFFDYYGTIGKMINESGVTFAKLCEWADNIRQMPYVYRQMVNDRMCIVVHAGYIEDLETADTEKRYGSVEEFYLYARDDAYMCGGIAHGMIIAGHTPTILAEEFPYNAGEVYRMYDKETDCIFYDIDCGCAMSSRYAEAKLACIRLEDEKVFYVRRSEVDF